VGVETESGAAEECVGAPRPTGVAAHRRAEFSAWVTPSLLAMTRLAIRLAPNADPEDVVQNALVRAWRKWDQFDERRGNASAWLLAITADQARSARRSRIRRVRLIDETAALPERGSADPVLGGDLDGAIARLARRQQLAVQLHYFVGLNIEQTAAVMGCSAGTVKSTLHDARARLRTILGEDDEH
jgi:RNA polymerase sigma factor (sigma-70 family)